MVPAALKIDPALLVVVVLMAVVVVAVDDAAAANIPEVMEPKPLPADDDFPNKDPPEDDTVASPAALAVVVAVASVFSKELKLGAPAEPPKTDEPEPKTDDGAPVVPAAEAVGDAAVAAERPTPESEAEVDSAVGLSALAKNPTGGEPV